MNIHLEKAMYERGVDTVSLSRLTGLSQATCWRVLHGEVTPTAKSRLLIATALALPVAAIFPINK